MAQLGKRPRNTLADMAAAIVKVYHELLPLRDFETVRSSNSLMGRRLVLLGEVATGALGADAIGLQDGLTFMDAVLDAVSLQAASGHESKLFTLPALGDASLLGPARERRAKLKGSSDELLDWQFQTLVQAWAATEGFGQPRDLRASNRVDGRRVCDFLVTLGTGGSDLLECKRYHPEKTASDPVAAATIKILDRLPGAADQLSQSATTLNAVAACRHLLIDIAAYCGAATVIEAGGVPVEVLGFDQGQIDLVLDAVVPNLPAGPQRIDKVSLCWRNSLNIGGGPCAIVQHVSSRAVAGCSSVFEYGGWTVEAYPLRASKYRELRVSTVPRSISWIVTTFNNLFSPETFFTIGPEEQVGT